MRVRQTAGNLHFGGGREVERPAVRGEGGETLPNSFLPDLRGGNDLVMNYIVHLKVRGKVIDFDELVLLDMEALAGGVGRVGDIVSGGMPVGIDAESERGIGLGVVGRQFATPLEERGAVLAADVQGEGRRVVPVGGMAVHAAVKLRVFQQSPLPERSQFAFVNAHETVHLITGLEQPVGKSVVDGIRRDEDAERLEGPPLPVKPAGNGHRQGVPDAPLEEVRPPLGGKTRGGAAGTQALPVRRSHPDIDRLGPFHREIQRGDSGGHRYAGIIGIKVGPAAGRCGILCLRLARSQHNEYRQEGKESVHNASCR